MSKKKRDLFAGRLFDVEHGINMHAVNCFYMPAGKIYDREVLEPHAELISRCHIYVIGFVPIINFANAQQKERGLLLTYEVLGDSYDIVWELPPEGSLHHEDGLFYVSDGSGNRFFPNEKECLQRLNDQYGLNKFLIKYIGQAYGKEGSRSALDRLTKHETLQKISLLGAPRGYRVDLLLVEVEPNNQVITAFNPFAENSDSGEARIQQGLDKLFNTSEQERVALYEAAMIRYFSPEFNKEFKNSFPSTNLKVLRDCYEKDFSSVSAELVVEGLPLTFYSEAVEPAHIHIAQHDLHTDEARKMFFASND